MKTYKEFIQEVYRQITIGPSPSRFGRARQQRDNSERAAFRRAGIQRSRPNQKIRFNAIRTDNTSTAITSYPNQTSYAREFMPDKQNTPTKQRALYLRRLARQTGNRTTRQVHATDILPTKSFNKNDPGYVQRGREFHQDVKDIPNKVKQSGGNPGDIIAGKASEVLSGSKNPQRGRAARERLYTRTLGASERDPITNIQTARVRE